MSKKNVVIWGVPQGSVLGLLFYLMCISNIYKAELLGSYTNNTVILSSGETTDSLYATIEDDITLLDNWMRIDVDTYTQYQKNPFSQQN